MTIRTLVARGATRSAIARLLGVREGTVCYQVKRMASGATDGRSPRLSRPCAPPPTCSATTTVSAALPRLKCSLAVIGRGGQNEAGEHGDT
jgi:hypothetical protein